MPKAPFATQSPITHAGHVISGNAYTGGPFKIVHHTTEGSTASGAIATYATTGSLPHFTVDDTTIYQHIDTSKSATALKDIPGGVRTNRDGAIQIEVVAFAAQSKKAATLANVAKLCRWIEEVHQVAREWPNGLPLPSGSHQHNRNAANWNAKSGHYGHSQVPENSHTDPGYTRAEVELVMGHDPVVVNVNGNPIADADAYLENGTVWTAARSVLQALGGDVMATGPAVISLSLGDQSIQVQARSIASGTAFIRVREFRQFSGVQVDYEPDNQPTINIAKTGA